MSNIKTQVEEIMLDNYCDLHGTTVGGTHPETGEGEPTQCEYCYRVRFPLKERITVALKEAEERGHREGVAETILEFRKLRKELDTQL